KTVALEDAHRVVGHSLDAVQQLHKINEKANHLLDELTGEGRIIDRIVEVVRGSLEFDGDPKKHKQYIQGVVKQVTIDRNLAIKAMTEIRGQLVLQLDILKTLYDMEAVQEFQKEVLEAIGEIEGNVRNKIITRLKERRALRGSLSISG
ncbi:MAG: hypothetical protein ABIJ26_08475, partial [Candidatus Margulisiibacteriota bacterium]